MTEGPHNDTVIDRVIDLIERLRAGESVTPKEIATRYKISVRSAQRLCLRVQRWVPLDAEHGVADGKLTSTRFTAKS